MILLILGGPGSTQGARKAMSGRVAGLVNSFETSVGLLKEGKGIIQQEPR